MLRRPGFDQMVRDWYVMPIDTEVGDLGDPVRLVGSDLEGKVPPRCSPDQDGWLVNTELSLAPAVRVLDPPSANLSGIELRLRLDPGRHVSTRWQRASTVCGNQSAPFDLYQVPRASSRSRSPRPMRTLGDGGSFVADSNFALRTAQKASTIETWYSQTQWPRKRMPT